MSGSARVLSGPVHVMSHSARVMSGSARIISGLIPLHSEISPNNEVVKITDLFSFFIHEAKPKNLPVFDDAPPLRELRTTALWILAY